MKSRNRPEVLPGIPFFPSVKKTRDSANGDGDGGLSAEPRPHGFTDGFRELDATFPKRLMFTQIPQRLRQVSPSVRSDPLHGLVDPTDSQLNWCGWDWLDPEKRLTGSPEGLRYPHRSRGGLSNQLEELVQLLSDAVDVFAEFTTEMAHIDREFILFGLPGDTAMVSDLKRQKARFPTCGRRPKRNGFLIVHHQNDLQKRG